MGEGERLRERIKGGVLPEETFPFSVMEHTYLNLQVHRGHLGVWLNHSRVKGHSSFLINLSHHCRLEDIATPTIVSEQALVQVHVHICGHRGTRSHMHEYTIGH